MSYATHRPDDKRTIEEQIARWDAEKKRKAGPAHMYRLYDKNGRLLYLGVSLSAVYRLERHLSNSPWAGQACRLEWEALPSRSAALKAEKEAVRAERPLFNIEHNRAPSYTVALSMEALATTERQVALAP